MNDKLDNCTTVSSPRDLREAGIERRELLRLVGGGSTLVLGTGLAGCTGDSDDGADGGDGGTPPEELVVARAGDAEGLDPHSVSSGYAGMVMKLMFDTLVSLDFDGNYHPAVGKGWEISDDGTTYSIEIRDGLTFHNGDELTADDVAFTFTRFIEKPSQLVFTAGPLESVEATGDSTVEFNFSKPHAPWKLYSTFNRFFGVLPRGPVESDPEGFNSNPIGSGPYELEEWTRGDHLTLARNDQWETPTIPNVTSEDPPLPKKITFRVIPEELPRVQALLQGDVDILIRRDFPASRLSQVQDGESTSVSSYLSSNVGYVAFNMEQGPTDDLAVREALAHAIDRERIISDIYNGLGEPIHTPMSPNLLGFNGEQVAEEIGYDHDPEAARQLLSDAGWEDTGGDYRTRDGETLSVDVISTNTPPPRLQLAEEMVSMFGDVGVDASLSSFEYNQAYAEAGKGNANVFYGTLGWFDPDMLKFLFFSKSAGATNLAYFKDEEVDELLLEGTTILDEQERASLYEEVQMKAMQQCPYQPIMAYEQATGLQDKVVDYKQQPLPIGAVYHDVKFE